jgi:hypothetical protein
MTAKLKLSAALDLVGIGALSAAAVALGSQAWIQGAAESNVFMSFFLFLGISLLAFLSARTLQIVDVVRHTPGPRTRRVVQAAAAQIPTVHAAGADDADPTDLPRAA